MMPDLFSMFDPQNNTIYSTSPTMYWLVTLLPLILLMPSKMSPTLTSKEIAVLLWTKIALNQTGQTLSIHLKLLPAWLSLIFSAITIINLSTMIPYSFNTSAHLIFTLPLGLPMWAALILSSIPAGKPFWAALVPTGTPNWLVMPLMLIELSSVMFRPVTLCFRLSANMTAGHIVLSLLASFTVPALMGLELDPIVMMLLTMAWYCIFEFGVCIIQAYIFCLLLSLYANEHPTT